MRKANEEDIDAISKMINLRGYIVIYSNNALKVGQVLPHIGHRLSVEVDHPFVVIAETDRADMIEQSKIWGAPMGKVPRPHYYRVITD